MVEWMFGQTVRLIGQGTDCEIVDNGRMTKTVHPMAYFEYWGINKNSTEGVIAPAGAKVTGATIRTWLLNKFISFLAVLTWKTGLKTM